MFLIERAKDFHNLVFIRKEQGMSRNFDNTKSSRRQQRNLDRVLHNIKGGYVNDLDLNDEKFDEFETVAPIHHGNNVQSWDEDYWD